MSKVSIKGRGNVLAVALAALAFAVAGTGTAVAVTGTVVNIADPSKPAHIAHVDAAGRLASAPPVSTIESTGGIGPDEDDALTSPTKATLAITKFDLSIPQADSSNPSSDYVVQLAEESSSSTTDCEPGDGPVRALAEYTVQPGDEITDSFPAPILVTPLANEPYCLHVDLQPNEGVTGWESAFANLGAYVISGTYTGTGTANRPSPEAQMPTHRNSN